MISEKKSFLVLNNKQHLPLKGLGTYQLTQNVSEVIKTAMEIGYRHIDTASFYKNEKEIGQALQEVFASSTITRKDLFLTAKIWNDEKEDVEKSLRASLARLQTDYVDLYLIHWPMGYYDNENNLKLKPLYKTWKEMEDCVKKGLCNAIGVSNFNTQLLLDLWSYAEIKPAVNEIEFHPYLQQVKLAKFCQNFGIQIIGYSNFVRNRIDVIHEPVLLEIAAKHKRKSTEVILKWLTNLNIAVIPKTTNFERLKENFGFDDVELDEEDMKKISSLHCGKRLTERICDEDFKMPLFD